MPELRRSIFRFIWSFETCGAKYDNHGSISNSTNMITAIAAAAATTTTTVLVAILTLAHSNISSN